MSKNTLYDKVFKNHIIKDLGDNQYQLFIGLHLLHEVTSPQAFAALKEQNLKVLYPELNFATVDHIIPTDTTARPYLDILAENMAERLAKNVKEHNIKFFSQENKENGIVHVIGPELGLTKPGMTICCGDSHTSTHGAFGAIAFGIGTSQVRDVLATQSIVINKLKVRKIEVNGKLNPGVFAKDIILHIINILGAKGGVGYAYEYSGTSIENLNMEERLTICNMSIEGGARCGYINPDQTTYDYLKNKKYAPKDFESAVNYWNGLVSDSNAEYDDIITINAFDIKPMITWGVGLDQSIAIDQEIPSSYLKANMNEQNYNDALSYMQFKPGDKIKDKKIDVAFIGSCTNARYSDFKLVANYIKESKLKVDKNIKAIVVPGSYAVKSQLEAEGIDQIFIAAGFEFREPGCSMCLAMNPDKLVADQVCASSSNRNYKGRQGSATGRTLIMSPLMVAASAVTGKVSDPREVFSI